MNTDIAHSALFFPAFTHHCFCSTTLQYQALYTKLLQPAFHLNRESFFLLVEIITPWSSSCCLFLLWLLQFQEDTFFYCSLSHPGNRSFQLLPGSHLNISKNLFHQCTYCSLHLWISLSFLSACLRSLHISCVHPQFGSLHPVCDNSHGAVEFWFLSAKDEGWR